MRPLRFPYQLMMLWLPLLVEYVLIEASGNSLAGPGTLPGWRPPIDLFLGVVLGAGGVITIFKPRSLDHWFSPPSSWSGIGERLHIVGFSCGLALIIESVVALRGG